MKELWLYQVKLFPQVKGLEKKIKKLQTQQEYEPVSYTHLLTVWQS